MRVLTVAMAMALNLFIFTGVVAYAHPVGTADEPNCHGQRVSHGANRSPIQEGHGDLEEGSQFGGGTPPERRDIVQGFIGEDITVGEWHKFIKTCPAPGEPPA